MPILHVEKPDWYHRSTHWEENPWDTLQDLSFSVGGDGHELPIFVPTVVEPLVYSYLEMLRSLYEFRDYARVAGFLRQHPEVIRLLLEACGVIQQYFDFSTTPILDILSDPESDPGRDKLLVWIPVKLSPSEALDLLEKFDEGWWQAASEAVRGLMNVDVMCVY